MGIRGLLFKKETFGDLELKVAIKFYNLYLSVEGSLFLVSFLSTILWQNERTKVGVYMLPSLFLSQIHEKASYNTLVGEITIPYYAIIFTDKNEIK